MIVYFSIWMIITTIWSIFKNESKGLLVLRYVVTFIFFCLFTHYLNPNDHKDGIIFFSFWLAISTTWTVITKQSKDVARHFYIITFIIFCLIHYLIA